MPPDPDDLLEATGEVIRSNDRKLVLERRYGPFREMTDEESQAQRISFVYGNLKLSDPDNPYITKELVAAIGSGATDEEVDAILQKIKQAEEAQLSLDVEPKE